MANPLSEVFGYPIDNETPEAIQAREECLCPFNNIVERCTKDRLADPLGTCSVFDHGAVTITCPVRFTEDWLIARDAAEFFFPGEENWKRIREVTLHDGSGVSAGNIDYVIAKVNAQNKIIDFGSVEIQAVYISGNIRNPFAAYMENPTPDFDWPGPNYPRPDFLSSSRKRLASQLLFKGGILHAWGKKQVIVIDEPFLAHLPEFEAVPAEEAELAIMVYNLDLVDGVYKLSRSQVIYTMFEDTMETMTKTGAGLEANFVTRLQKKLNAQ